MKSLITFFAAALLMLPASAEPLNDVQNCNVTESEPELVFHTAAPGIIVESRSDASQMVMAYDVTLTPREDQVYFRWRSLDENGEGQGFWTRWREYEEVLTFTVPGRYVLETYAQAIGKDESPTLNVTFKVDYLGMTVAPGIKLMPVDQRGYNISLNSPYGHHMYYRWRDYNSDFWNNWQLYTGSLPFTEAGKYVFEANCEGDALGAYFEVPSIDYYLTGDVDHNGNIDIADLTTLINMLLNEDLLIATGDVNKDGKVTIDDVTTLINMLLKID